VAVQAKLIILVDYKMGVELVIKQVIRSWYRFAIAVLLAITE
jgi:hypothetical protein